MKEVEVGITIEPNDIKIENKNDKVTQTLINNLMEVESNKHKEDKIEMSTNETVEMIKESSNIERTAIIGIGQCGGNIVQLGQERGCFLTCAVNTSKEDLAGLDVNLKYMFKNAAGSGKERSRSKNIFKSNIEDFDEFFSSNFEDVRNIIIIASAAGGTGGGSAPMCARFLKDNYPNKNIFLIVVLGSIYEDIKSQENTINVLEELNKSEVNYLVFDVNGDESYDKVDKEVIDAAEFISRNYFVESNISNIDMVDMQKLYIENKRMIIVSGNFDTKISNKTSLDQQLIDAVHNTSQCLDIVNPMSYALFISDKQEHKSILDNLDTEFRSLVDEFGEPYEIYKHIQYGPKTAPDFVICMTGLGDTVTRYKITNERLDEFNKRKKELEQLSDIDKVTINARSQQGVKLPGEIDANNDGINKKSLDLFM